MTQLRKQKDAISNYFDSLLAGIGHRGSSFTDADAITHDGATKRWLVQEFKQDGERLDKAQHWMLSDLATLPRHFTVWVVVRRNDGRIGWAQFPDVKQTYRVMSTSEYQGRFAAWWSNEKFALSIEEQEREAIQAESTHTPVDGPPDVSEINW